MSWQQAVQECIQRAVRPEGLHLVISPDVDGITATVLVTMYTRVHHDVPVVVIGTYDSEHLRLVEGYTVEDTKHALWLDLDVNFNGNVKHVLGQHFLGNVQVETPAYFNPNLFFDVRCNMGKKCPISTTHLVLWGLFGDEAIVPILKHKFSLARAAIAHADSLYWIVDSYSKNVNHWAKQLFPTSSLPKTLQLLMDGEYQEHAAKVHHHFLTLIGPHLKSTTFKPKDWTSFRGHQTVKDEDHLEHVRAMIHIVAQCFRNDPPSMGTQGRVAWKGKREYLNTMQYDWTDAHFQAQLREKGVVSHAIVNTQTVSATTAPQPLFV